MAQVAYISTGALAGGLLTSNCASIWTMCYISIQRHRAIVKPLSTVTSAKNSSRPLLAIFVTALLFNVPVWFEFTWSIGEFQTDDGETRWFIYHTKSALALNPIYILIVSALSY